MEWSGSQEPQEPRKGRGQRGGINHLQDSPTLSKGVLQVGKGCWYTRVWGRVRKADWINTQSFGSKSEAQQMGI